MRRRYMIPAMLGLLIWAMPALADCPQKQCPTAAQDFSCPHRDDPCGDSPCPITSKLMKKTY